MYGVEASMPHAFIALHALCGTQLRKCAGKYISKYILITKCSGRCNQQPLPVRVCPSVCPARPQMHQFLASVLGFRPRFSLHRGSPPQGKPQSTPENRPITNWHCAPPPSLGIYNAHFSHGASLILAKPSLMVSVHSMKFRSFGTLHSPPSGDRSYFPFRLSIRGAAKDAYQTMRLPLSLSTASKGIA